MNRSATHVEILALLAERIHGDHSALSTRMRDAMERAEIDSVSIDYIRHACGVYRIVKLSTGERFLAVRYRRSGGRSPRPWLLLRAACTADLASFRARAERPSAVTTTPV